MNRNKVSKKMCKSRSVENFHCKKENCQSVIENKKIKNSSIKKKNKNSAKIIENLFNRFEKYEQKHKFKIEQLKETQKKKEDDTCQQFSKIDKKSFDSFINRTERFKIRSAKEREFLIKKKEDEEKAQMKHNPKLNQKMKKEEINEKIELLLNIEKERKIHLQSMKELYQKQELAKCTFKPSINKNADGLADLYLERLKERRVNKLNKNYSNYQIQNSITLFYPCNTPPLDRDDTIDCTINGRKRLKSNDKCKKRRKNSFFVPK